MVTPLLRAASSAICLPGLHSSLSAGVHAAQADVHPRSCARCVMRCLGRRSLSVSTTGSGSHCTVRLVGKPSVDMQFAACCAPVSVDSATSCQCTTLGTGRAAPSSGAAVDLPATTRPSIWSMMPTLAHVLAAVARVVLKPLPLPREREGAGRRTQSAIQRQNRAVQSGPNACDVT